MSQAKRTLRLARAIRLVLAAAAFAAVLAVLYARGGAPW